MRRPSIFIAALLAFAATGNIHPAKAGNSVATDLPPSIDRCFQRSISGIFDISRNDDVALFEYFLSNLNIEQFGRHNFRRAWQDWGDNEEIKRLALFEYFDLMTQKRSEHGAGTVDIDARLAQNPMVKGNNVHHIVAKVDFSNGSSMPIVVFSVGCKAFGFMYGGTDLRALVDVNVIEKLYRDGVRAP